MKKTILKSLTILALTVFCFGFTASNYTAPDKITICHTPPGNPDNCHEITISIKALDAHKDHHGDQLICHVPAELPTYQALSAATGITLSTN